MVSPHTTAPIILVGVDFSDCALTALEEAQALARQLGLRLAAVHVRERSAAGEPWTPAMRQWLAQAGLGADQIRVREGQPWIELAREAAECGAGVLFVGGHGRSGVHPLQLGSTTVKLGLIAPCPLVVVGPRAATRTHAQARWEPTRASHATPHRG